MSIAVPVITGIGLVTPLGDSAPETWTRLLDGHFIKTHTRLRAQCNDLPRVTDLALRAAGEAISHAGWDSRTLADDATGLVVGTSKGSVESWLAAASETSVGATLASPLSPRVGADPRVRPLHRTEGRTHGSAPTKQQGDASVAPTENDKLLGGYGIADTASCVAQELGFGYGPKLTVSAACASGLHALARGAMLLVRGEVRRVLVVAAEASVHPLFVGSFQRLGVLPREGVGCRPFDKTRDGFLMSEAAAAVCLEDAERTRQRALAMVEQFALGGDATHLTGGDPHGATLRHLLRQTVGPRPVDLFHAHGTGTPLNDPMELAAMEDRVGATQRPPPAVYSHKGALGHSFGAAGLVSVVLNCLCHRHGIVPPNVQTRDPLPAPRLSIMRQVEHRQVRRSVAIAAGFGGPTGVVTMLSGEVA